MPDLEADQLLGLRIEAGEVRATAVDRRDVAGPHVDAAARRIAGIARRAIGPDASWFRPPVTIETLLGWVATEAPELLRRPLPPITDVLSAAVASRWTAGSCVIPRPERWLTAINR